MAPLLYGTLHEVLGPILFFGIWLAYGFCSGQVLVFAQMAGILTSRETVR